MKNNITRKKLDNSIERQKKTQGQFGKVLDNPGLNVQQNIKAEYDMWGWIYQEIANIRIEISRMATAVRINNKSSPGYLEAYHSHIYSFLVIISPILDTKDWGKINDRWLKAKTDVDDFFKRKRAIPNTKIPFKLIQDLDALYRIALMMAQHAGLGIKVTLNHNLESAIENAIVGD